MVLGKERSLFESVWETLKRLRFLKLAADSKLTTMPSKHLAHPFAKWMSTEGQPGCHTTCGSRLSSIRAALSTMLSRQMSSRQISTL